MKTRVTWPAALVIVALLGAVTVLGAMGRSVTELISLGALILGGLFYGQIQSLRDNTNGNQARLLEIVSSLAMQEKHSPAKPETVGVQGSQSDSNAETVAGQRF